MRQERAFGRYATNTRVPKTRKGVLCLSSVAVGLIHQRDKPAGVFMNDAG
jgi:hypothetical protein